jgi:hypothetical protein
MISDLNLDLSPLSLAILHTVVYADIFDYPLSLYEIQRYLTSDTASIETVSALLQDGSIVPGLLNRMGEYYVLRGREKIVSTRKRRKQIASHLWLEAIRFGRMIASLPFVRMVSVTGSLAMNNVEENGDIDYLIVTANDHLWFCRLLVLLVVRLASWRGVNLCPNYIISERALKITPQSLYAAHEFAQMVPLSGMDVYQQMRILNSWVKDYLPNADGIPAAVADQSVRSESVSWLRTMLEAILMTPLGTWLERWEMNRKIRKLSMENIGNLEATFNTDLCKGHSNRHGQRTEMVLRERLAHLSLETVN